MPANASAFDANIDYLNTAMQLMASVVDDLTGTPATTFDAFVRQALA